MPKVTVMETREDGSRHGWLGVKCPRCNGIGEVSCDDRDRPCGACGGTGEAYGEITDKETPSHA